MKKATLIVFLIVALFTQASIAATGKSVTAEIKRIELGIRIAKMVGADQALRMGTMHAYRKGIDARQLDQSATFCEELATIDKRNGEAIKQIIAKHGFPKVSEYGSFTPHNVWLLVQHQGNDLPFQKKVLGMMKELNPQNEVSRINYAYLYDRVQANQNKPQRYGTQGRCNKGKWEMKETEDVANVDKRRKEIGLEPMAEYEKKVFCN